MLNRCSYVPMKKDEKLMVHFLVKMDYFTPYSELFVISLLFLNSFGETPIFKLNNREK
jgi:hypothetical protein